MRCSLLANQITWSRLLIQFHILNGNHCRSRSVDCFRSQLIWVYNVCKGRAYPGSAEPGIIITTLQTRGRCKQCRSTWDSYNLPSHQHQHYLHYGFPNLSLNYLPFCFLIFGLSKWTKWRAHLSYSGLKKLRKTRSIFIWAATWEKYCCFQVKCKQ